MQDTTKYKIPGRTRYQEVRATRQYNIRYTMKHDISNNTIYQEVRNTRQYDMPVKHDQMPMSTAQSSRYKYHRNDINNYEIILILLWSYWSRKIVSTIKGNSKRISKVSCQRQSHSHCDTKKHRNTTNDKHSNNNNDHDRNRNRESRSNYCWWQCG